MIIYLYVCITSYMHETLGIYEVWIILCYMQVALYYMYS